LSCWFGDFPPYLASITLQPSQPLLRIFNLSNTWVSVLPEGELSANHGLGNVMSGPNLAEPKQLLQSIFLRAYKKGLDGTSLSILQLFH
jgi:hypothetical protein